MAIDVTKDGRYFLEDDNKVSGNVLTNDVTKPSETCELEIVPGSLTSEDGEHADGNGTIQGKYGTLTLNQDGTYTYELKKDMNYLGAGKDVHEIFTYKYHEDGGDKEVDGQLNIDIHGVNDQVKISDVVVSVYEADADAKVLSRIDTTPGEVFKGQLVLEDVDPTKAGVQLDLDEGDTHCFKLVNDSITISSADVAAKYLPKAEDIFVDIDPDTGKYTLEGNFDALSEGETATVTFKYAVEETSSEGNVTLSDPKTVTMTIIGTNDAVAIVDDLIQTYDQLIDGDIYKSILHNDTEAGVDVNEKLQIIGTGYKSINFWKNGGEISVNNAAQTLEYTPGSGGAISKDEFKFCYQATDGFTDDIGNANVNVNMTNKNSAEIDFYQFGGASSDTINGIAGKTNVLSGMKGNDKLYGKEKGDILYGGEGDDVLQGGWGDDIYVAGKGNDGIVDTRGNDMYVFSKGDGYNTVDDLNLEIYTDAMGHETINRTGYDSEGDDRSRDIIFFDKSVKKTEVAIFQEKGTSYDSLKIKYSKNDDDKVSVGWQPEDHYGIEFIAFEGAEFDGGTVAASRYSVLDDDNILTITEINLIMEEIAKYDINPNEAGLQTAQSVQDVENSEYLMAFIQQYV